MILTSKENNGIRLDFLSGDETPDDVYYVLRDYLTSLIYNSSSLWKCDARIIMRRPLEDYFDELLNETKMLLEEKKGDGSLGYIILKRRNNRKIDKLYDRIFKKRNNKMIDRLHDGLLRFVEENKEERGYNVTII